MRKLKYHLAGLLISLVGVAGGRADETSVYGNRASGEAALMGMFYDLKQTPQHVGTDSTQYVKIIDEFLGKHWDESVLNRFYRAARPIYATQIFIPVIDAAQGPKAFGVEKLVQPNFYLINYKGQVEVPATGTYRFAGYGDNVMDVAVDEKTVLVANRNDVLLPTFKWTATGQGAQGYPDANLVDGTWLNLRAGQVIDLDVLIGESYGGVSGFFLLIEKQGDHYQDDGKGHPILPIFQVAPYNTPDTAPPGSFEPKFSHASVIWKCLQ